MASRGADHRSPKDKEARKRENLVFAFCYNIAFIPLAMGVLGGFGIFLHPMFCAFAMTCSSLSVVANAARLKAFKIL